MKHQFVLQSVEYDDPLRFSTPGEYSVDAALELLTELETEFNCEVVIDNWKGKGNGFIVEKGVSVRYESIEFELMCSYEDIFIKRVSGNKTTFLELCEHIKNMGCKNA